MEDIIELKRENLRKERYKFLHNFEKTMEIPMILFSMAWAILLPLSLLLLHKIVIISFFISWGVIITDFIIRVSVAPFRVSYLKGNILLIVSVYLPFVRVYRLFSILKNERVSQEYYRTVSFRNKKRWIE